MNTLKPWQVQPLSHIGIRFPSQRLTNDAISTKILPFCSGSDIFSNLTSIGSHSYYSLHRKGKIEQGFRSNGLGIPSISEVPGYTSLRRNLLQLAPSYELIEYNIGWSHGKEQLESGKPWYPSYCGPNIWPRDAVPELELLFKALVKLILDVGFLLTYHCDRYASNGFKVHENEGLLQILLRSRCHKGRLLYYFPSLQRDEKLRFPKEVNIHEFMVPDESISFGDYTEKLLDKCYDPK